MSTSSPQAKAAGENAAWQANLSAQLGGVAIPELQKLLGGYDKPGLIQNMLAQRDSSGRLPGDAAALAGATDELNRGYGRAGFNAYEGLNYAGLRSGEGRRSPGAMSGAWQGMATGLERDRMQALNNLQFMSAQSSMTDYNKLLGLMGQGVQTSLGLAQGFSGASNAAIGGLSTQTQMGSALGGMSAGAALGAGIGSIIPGLGTAVGGLVGGVAGGAAGYFGYGG